MPAATLAEAETLKAAADTEAFEYSTAGAGCGVARPQFAVDSLDSGAVEDEDSPM